MVICSHPLATREAINVLKNGGNACDAGLCAAIVQTVIEPHMTGITGILSVLYYDAASGETSYVNAGWNTPSEPLGKVTMADIKSGRALGVPGWWAGFEAALERHGIKSKKEIMAPAIRYARDGFELHPFLWGEIFVQSHRIGLSEMGREIFMPGNVVPRPGVVLYQKRAADTLERLLEEGNEFYYRGDFAEALTRVVQKAGGVVTRQDMEAYEADFNPAVRKKAKERGFRFDVVNPWNWHHGAFEGIHVDPASGTIHACGDPRRCSKAEGL